MIKPYIIILSIIAGIIVPISLFAHPGHWPHDALANSQNLLAYTVIALVLLFVGVGICKAFLNNKTRKK